MEQGCVLGDSCYRAGKVFFRVQIPGIGDGFRPRELLLPFITVVVHEDADGAEQAVDKEGKEAEKVLATDPGKLS